MKPTIVCLLFIVLFFAGCSFSNHKAIKQQADTLVTKKIVQDSIDGNECIFDTSTYKFTTEKLKQFDRNISFLWDNKNEQAIVMFPGKDTLLVHIGGCVEFSYTAIYSTDSSRFNDSAYLFEKAAWLAKNFLGGGFDSKYTECVINKHYILAKDGFPNRNLRSYDIINADTAMTNKIYEPFQFELRGSRTIITIGGYEN
jgi:hypothetical protein